MLECVVNVSEGRPGPVLDALTGAAGGDLLDVHLDADHHRAVLTLVGEEAPRSVARAAVATIDLRRHTGVHPRLGAVDVVPFVPVVGDGLGEAILARDRFAAWLGRELGVPAFVYGEAASAPSLPEVRRRAFRDLAPVAGPALPHPTAGATAVGARRALVAYNLWLAEPDLARAREVARTLRGPAVRALGLRVGAAVQVSCNLTEPLEVGPAEVFDVVARQVAVARAELVGLLPEAVLRATPSPRWPELDLAPERTLEARLAGRRT